MGFTPMEGRDRDGGLLGVAGDADMRAVLARDDEDARLEIDTYVHRLRAAGAAVRTLVVTAREDLEVARQVRAALA